MSLRKELKNTLPLQTGVVHPTSSTQDIYTCCAVFSILTLACATDLVRHCATPSTLVLGAPVKSISSANRPTRFSYISSASSDAKLSPELYNLFEQEILVGLQSCHRQSKTAQLEMTVFCYQFYKCKPKSCAWHMDLKDSVSGPMFSDTLVFTLSETTCIKVQWRWFVPNAVRTLLCHLSFYVQPLTLAGHLLREERHFLPSWRDNVVIWTKRQSQCAVVNLS